MNYSFFTPKAPFMLDTIKQFENYIFDCWRNGWKSTKIHENWHLPINDEDIQIAFVRVTDKYFQTQRVTP